MNPDFLLPVPAMSATMERLGWVLLHSLWQFAAVAAAVALVLALLGRSTSAARHGVLVAGLLAMAVLPVVTWGLLDVAPGAVGESSTAHVATRRESVAALDHATDAAAESSLPVIGLACMAWADVVSVATLGERLRPWLGFCVVVWLAGVAACAVRPLVGWLVWRRLVTAGDAVPAEVARMVSRVCRKLGVTRSVRILSSAAVRVPAVSGWLKPVMLVPASLLTALPPSQIEAIIIHELAHVRRGDLAFLLLQTLLETLAFYHPAVWWLSGRLRVEREHCCDDLVVATTGGLAAYGWALVAVEELRGSRLALAACASDGSLVSRIHRLVTGVEPRGGAWPLPAFAASAVAGIVVAAGLAGPATADPPPQGATQIMRLTPERAREIIATAKNDAAGDQQGRGGNVLHLDGPTAIDAQAATVLASFGGAFLRLDGVAQLDADTAKALAEFKGQGLVLNGLTTLDADTAKALAECSAWSGQLPKLTKLDAKTAKALAEFKGQVLALNGLTTLDAKTAKALAECKCQWLSLEGLTTLDADTAKTLAEFKGQGLALNGLTTLDADTAKTLAEFKGQGLALNGLTTLDADTAKALAECSAWSGQLPKLTKLDAKTAKALAEFKGQVLNLNGLTTLDAKTAKALAERKCQWLSLRGLTALDPGADEALAESKAWTGELKPQFSGELGDKIPLTEQSARVVAACRFESRIGLPCITAFDSPDSVAIARILARRIGPLSLPNLKKISPKTLSALIEKKDIDIPLIATLELIPEPDGSLTEDFVIPDGFQQR
jgi:beta-lactamase regulating signal transducer with metallopeptidase domain